MHMVSCCSKTIPLPALLSELKACTISRNLNRGKEIHESALQSGHAHIVCVANTLINMYGKCGSTDEARRVFDKLQLRTVVSWNALILGYADNGQDETALQTLSTMRNEGFEPDGRTLVTSIKACSNLTVEAGSAAVQRGQAVHLLASRLGHDENSFVQKALIDLYSRCRRMDEASTVFSATKHPDAVAWTALVLGYADNWDGHTALSLFRRMAHEGCEPIAKTFVAALKACNELEENSLVEKVRAIHSLVLKSDCCRDIYVESTLIDMYSRCGCMKEAQNIFDCMRFLDVVSWNTLIHGYAENGEAERALSLFSVMNSTPNARTLVACLKACTYLALEDATEIAAEIASEKGRALELIACGFGSHTSVENTLVDMYAKCRNLKDARRVFSKMQVRDNVSWNALMLGYAENGEGEMSLDLFVAMVREGCLPDARSFVAAVGACAALALEDKAEACAKGKAIHLLACRNGCDSSMYVENSLVDMYGKCKCMADSRTVFDRMKNKDLASWNALLLGYATGREGQMALDLLSSMRLEERTADARTFVAALKACADLALQHGALEKGKAVHLLSSTVGLDSVTYVGNTLVDMYAKCGSMEMAQLVFDAICHPEAVSWNALAHGYVENGEAVKAVDLFVMMGRYGCAPDAGSFIAAIKACASIGSGEGLARGRALHFLASLAGCDSDSFLQNSLVDLYAKCGSLCDARKAFDRIQHPQVVAWNVLMMGYVEHGEGHHVLDLFERMSCEPNTLSLVAALKACSVVGSLELGRAFHAEISTRGFQDDTVLSNCLVDFYARSGSLAEAELVFGSHSSRNLVSWNALMAGYSRTGDTDGAFGVFDRMLSAGLQPDGITFNSLLTACSHTGLVEEGKRYLDSMFTKHGVLPGLEHFTCVVDMLGRANKLDQAMALVRSSPCSPDEVIWISVLAACRKWKYVQLGSLAFQSLASSDDGQGAGTYALMANLRA